MSLGFHSLSAEMAEAELSGSSYPVPLGVAKDLNSQRVRGEKQAGQGLLMGWDRNAEVLAKFERICNELAEFISLQSTLYQRESGGHSGNSISEPFCTCVFEILTDLSNCVLCHCQPARGKLNRGR
jgi:hypothetical protein